MLKCRLRQKWDVGDLLIVFHLSGGYTDVVEKIAQEMEKRRKEIFGE